MSPILKKAVRILKYLFMALVLLFLVLVGAVNLPFVHKAITKKTNTILADKGIPAHIDKITLLLNGKIGISGLEIIKPGADTLIYAGKVSVDLRPLPLFSKKLIINSIYLSDAAINILTDSVTSEMNIVSVFKSTDAPPKPAVETLNSENSDPWDIDLRSIQFKNIRFTYSDPSGGILVKENLAKAEIDFDTFSLLKKQIDVDNIEIDKPVGMVAIWEGKLKAEVESTTTPDWKFSAKNLEINDLIFTLNQPDAGDRIDIALKNGNISLDKLDLASSEIFVDEIELNEPDITFYKDNSVTKENVTETSSLTFSIPAFPWTIWAEKFKIKDASLNYITSNQSESESLEKWLPIYELSASFDNIKLTPAGYNLNLEKISFALANTLKITSGLLQFNTDSLQNIGLKANLSALVAANKFKGITKETRLDLSAALSGSTKALQIENIGLKSSSGLSFNISGKISDLLQMPQSKCDLQFNSGNITRNQLTTIVKVFSPKTELPGFKSFTVAGNIKNSLAFPVFTLDVRSGSGNISAAGNYNVQNTKGELDVSFTEILLSELFDETYPEKLTGKLHLKGDINQGNNIAEGEANIHIDSVMYKNKNTRNLSIQALAENNVVRYNLTAADSALKCNLEGSFGWTDQKEYRGDLRGYFDVDLFGMNLISQPLAGKGKIDASFDFSAVGITSKTNLNDFTIRNKNTSANIKNTEFEINTTDSLIESRLESDFLSLNFKSRASFADFKNAFDSTQLKTAIILDSANFINLNAITKLDYFNLDATIKYDSVFNLFYPDSVLNFSDINIQISKTEKDSIATGTISADWIIYNKIKSFKPQLTTSIRNNRLSFGIQTENIVAEQVKFGKSGVTLDVLPSNITGNLFISNNADSILHMIGFEAERINELVIFKSATPDWIINKTPYALLPREFLTWDKSTKSFTASLDMHSGEKKIQLLGNSSKNVEFDFKNIELKNFAIPGIIGFVPDGIINGNIKYSHKESDNVELALEMNRMKWGDIHINKLTANGHLIADSTGILESELLITADDSLSIAAQMVSNNAKNEYQVKSKFNKLQFQLFEPFINDYASNLHGTSSGEIVVSNKEDKIAMDGEIRFNNFGLKIIPLKTWLTIPDNKIEIKQNQFNFNNFTVIDSLNRPLTVNGKINFENSDDVRVDLKVKADKIQLMNTTETKDTPLFGSLIVNSGLTIGGTVYSPSIKGNIELESGTNLTYQLIQDLSVEGSQTDVVFATITDSMKVIYPKSGIVKKATQMPNIETTISINPKSIFNVKIADLYNVDITIAGNGLLNYNMLPNNTMSLNGSYEIKTGDCKLKITGWPLKNFNITSGSTFTWNGSVEDPVLNLEATTKVRGSYLNPIDNKSRAVDFIVSMKLKNRLSNLAIVFDIQSPDQYITSVLSSLSADDMMQQAINLLLFETINIPGMETSSNYLSSQISSFWESQLNSISGSTLHKTKLSFGVDTYDQSTAAGGKQEKTSLTYEMERKFMKDRATIKVSGRLNDYNEGSYQTNSLINNFIFEYALDSLDTKNLKMYQKRDYEDMLEGEVTKWGIGFLYRKNYKKLHDIWRREKKQKEEKQKNSNN